jgi:hypothetical protein
MTITLMSAPLGAVEPAPPPAAVLLAAAFFDELLHAVSSSKTAENSAGIAYR